MYPMMRLVTEGLIAVTKPKIALDGVHESHHRCWPWDIDFNFEMNNGRILTIYDLGRVPLAIRVGLAGVMWRNKWGFAVAGTSIRYRRRIGPFERFTLKSRAVGRDDKFVYITQTMLKRDGEAASSALLRTAIVKKGKIVPTQEVADAAGQPDWAPELPDWVAAWIAADGTRPWPPE